MQYTLIFLVFHNDSFTYHSYQITKYVLTTIFANIFQSNQKIINYEDYLPKCDEINDLKGHSDKSKGFLRLSLAE